MKKAILATKVGMTQIFNADGVLVPVTVLEAGPCSVTQIKTVENDGYSAVQVAYADKKEKVVSKDANGKKEIRNRHGVNKAQMGHFAKAGVSGKRFVKEFKFENADEYKLGDVIKADIFAEGDKIDATAISKGKATLILACSAALTTAGRAFRTFSLLRFGKMPTIHSLTSIPPLIEEKDGIQSPLFGDLNQRQHRCPLFLDIIDIQYCLPVP